MWHVRKACQAGKGTSCRASSFAGAVRRRFRESCCCCCPHWSTWIDCFLCDLVAVRPCFNRCLMLACFGHWIVFNFGYDVCKIPWPLHFVLHNSRYDDLRYRLCCIQKSSPSRITLEPVWTHIPGYNCFLFDHGRFNPSCFTRFWLVALSKF